MNISQRQNSQKDTNLHVRLLGGFRLDAESGPVEAIGRTRVQLLLAYLILHGRTASTRSQVAYLFWPDSSEKQAHADLRNVLFYLRQALPDIQQSVHITAQTVQWRAEASFTVDVIEFEAAVEQADLANARDDRADMQQWLEQAVAQYGGDLLPECYDDWILLERERLAQRFARTLHRLVQVSEEIGDYDRAIAVAERLLRHDPLRETTHRLLMRLYDLAGDRAGSLRLYQACAALLMRELGVEPAAHTTALYRRLRTTGQPAASEGVASANIQAGSSGGGVQPQQASRRRGWQAQTNAGYEAQRGNLQIGPFAGEVGIGRMRLARQPVGHAMR